VRPIEAGMLYTGCLKRNDYYDMAIVRYDFFFANFFSLLCSSACKILFGV
jgi:hypothetical protein